MPAPAIVAVGTVAEQLVNAAVQLQSLEQRKAAMMAQAQAAMGSNDRATALSLVEQVESINGTLTQLKAQVWQYMKHFPVNSDHTGYDNFWCVGRLEISQLQEGQGGLRDAAQAALTVAAGQVSVLMGGGDRAGAMQALQARSPPPSPLQFLPAQSLNPLL